MLEVVNVDEVGWYWRLYQTYLENGNEISAEKAFKKYKSVIEKLGRDKE